MNKIITDKKIKRNTISIIILSALFVGLKYFGIWVEGFGGMFILSISGLSGLILLFQLIVNIIITIMSQRIKLIIPIMIGILAIIFVIFEPVEYIIEDLKSPAILFAYCRHTVTTVSIILRKDKTFEYDNGAFMAKEIYYGNYIIIGDTLKLRFNKEPKKIIQNTLVFINNKLIEIGDSLEHKHNFKVIRNKVD